jgi:hypothetical protein
MLVVELGQSFRTGIPGSVIHKKSISVSVKASIHDVFGLGYKRGFVTGQEHAFWDIALGQTRPAR